MAAATNTLASVLGRQPGERARKGPNIPVKPTVALEGSDYDVDSFVEEFEEVVGRYGGDGNGTLHRLLLERAAQAGV